MRGMVCPVPRAPGVFVPRGAGHLQVGQRERVVMMRFEHDVIISNQRVRIDHLARQRDRFHNALERLYNRLMLGRSSCPYCDLALQHRPECPFWVLSETEE